MRNRHRHFRNLYGFGRGQLGGGFFGRRRFAMRDQFGNLIVSQGRGRMGGDKPGSGPAGNCVCPECGKTIPHATEVPCNELSCPNCGATMTRE